MTACLDTCTRPTPAQCHCATCYKTWGGVTGFDAHRRNGQCVEPKGYVEVKGVWRQPAPANPFWVGV